MHRMHTLPRACRKTVVFIGFFVSNSIIIAFFRFVKGVWRNFRKRMKIWQILLWVEWILGRKLIGSEGGRNRAKKMNTAKFFQTPLCVDDYIKFNYQFAL